MAEKRQRGSKYEFPTRILARAEKLIARLLKNRGIRPDSERYPEFFNAAFNLSQELILVRLMELNWLLAEGWLSEKFENKDLAGFLKQLDEFNEILGLKIFKPEQDARLEPGIDDLSAFVHELYLPSFLSRKSPPELLGGLLEKMQIIHPEQAPFFTPGHLVDMMVDESFVYLGLDHGRIEDREFMILDPSFGSGNFLLGLLRRLVSVEEDYYSKRPSGLFYPLTRLPDLSRSIEFELRLELFQKHIFGLELSESGKLSALRSLALVLLQGQPLAELKPGLLAFLDQNLAMGDFLVDAPLRIQIDLFDRDRFSPLVPFNLSDQAHPHSRAAELGGFDLIIGNPPWLSLKGKHGLSPYSPEAVQWLIEHYHADSYRPNLFEMFIRRAISLLKNEGLNCFIVPDRMAENLQFESLRAFMVAQGEILRLHFREPFPGVISDTLIYWLKKKTSASTRKIEVTDYHGHTAQLAAKKFQSRGGGIEKELSAEVSSLLEKIRAESRGKMSDYFFCGVGLIARPGSIHQEKMTQLEQPLIKGENVQRWGISGHYYFEFHHRNLLGGTIRYSKLTAKERILVRKTGIKLIAAMDQSGAMVEQSAYFLIPRPGKRLKYPLEYFLALINSPLLNFYYRNFLVTNPESTPQLKKFHLDELPVKKINLKDDREKEMLERMVALVKQISETEGEQDRAKIENDINQIVFKLHNLKSEEINLIKQFF